MVRYFALKTPLKNAACNRKQEDYLYFPVFPTLRVLDRAVFPGKYRSGISRTTLSLALARIGHATRHFVNNTMTTNFVSEDCPTVNHEMQRVSQSYANLKNPAVQTSRDFPRCANRDGCYKRFVVWRRGLLTGLPVGSVECISRLRPAYQQCRKS